MARQQSSTPAGSGESTGPNTEPSGGGTAVPEAEGRGPRTEGQNTGDTMSPKGTDPQSVASNVKEREGVTTDRAAEHQAVLAGTTSAPLDEDGVVIGGEDTVSDFEEGGGQVMVTLTKNVYEEFYFPNTNRPSYRLLYTKGQVIPKSTIEALNDEVEARKARNQRAASGELDESNPAGIDSSTLASGTYPGVQVEK